MAVKAPLSVISRDFFDLANMIDEANPPRFDQPYWERVEKMRKLNVRDEYFFRWSLVV